MLLLLFAGAVSAIVWRPELATGDVQRPSMDDIVPCPDDWVQRPSADSMVARPGNDDLVQRPNAGVS